MWANSRHKPSHAVPLPAITGRGFSPPPTPPLAARRNSPTRAPKPITPQLPPRTADDSPKFHALFTTVAHSFEAHALVEGAAALQDLVKDAAEIQSWRRWKEGADVQNGILRAYTSIDRLIRTQCQIPLSPEQERRLYLHLRDFVLDRVGIEEGSDIRVMVGHVLSSCAPRPSCEPPILRPPSASPPPSRKQKKPVQQQERGGLTAAEQAAATRQQGGILFDARAIKKSRSLVKAGVAVFKKLLPDMGLCPKQVTVWLKDKLAEHDKELCANNAAGTIDWLQSVQLCVDECGLGRSLTPGTTLAILITIVLYGVQHPGHPIPPEDQWTGTASTKDEEALIFHGKRSYHRLQRDVSLGISIFSEMKMGAKNALLNTCAELIPATAGLLVTDANVESLEEYSEKFPYGFLQSPPLGDPAASLLAARVCLQASYKARFSRPYGVGAAAIETLFEEMLLVKRRADSDTLHRTETETLRQRIGSGMVALMAAMQKVGLGELANTAFLMGKGEVSWAAAMMEARHARTHERVSGVPYIRDRVKSSKFGLVYDSKLTFDPLDPNASDV